MAKEIVLMLGTFVSSGGSSLASGKCSGKGLHNFGLYMFTHCQDNTPRLLVRYVCRKRASPDGVAC